MNEQGQLFFGAGAGDFLALVNDGATPGWEYNMVRWLERQGYDVTYASSIDIHRSWPANKAIKSYLSVGHEEYWSGMMRTNVETMRDQGVNLGFFSANTCYWQIHFDPSYSGERVFAVNKNPNTTNDLWRRTLINHPERLMIGEEFIFVNGYTDINGNIRMPTNRPAGSGIDGLHWAYDHSGLTNLQIIPGVLGAEVDGCWNANSCNCIDTVCPGTNIIRLADSEFSCTLDCASSRTGHCYVTIYSAPSGAQVFATGSMQWNWGLDDFAIGVQLPWTATSRTPPWGTSRVHPAVQQMTHNVLRKFSGNDTAPVIFQTADASTGGNWTSLYPTNGYWIADTTSLTNLPSYAQMTISSQHVQVWTNLSTDARALLKPPAFTNRIASGWTTTNTQGSSFTIDLNLTDTNSHQVALYCVDWLGTGTTLQKIDIFESSDLLLVHPLDSRSLQLPVNGVYLVWKLTGHKIIRVSKPDTATETKAMVSGLFIGGGL